MPSSNKFNWSRTILSAIFFGAAILSISDPSSGQTINPAVQQIPLPGAPFAAVTTLDGRYVFVSMVITPTTGGVAVIRQRRNFATLKKHIIATCGSAHGMAMSKGGRYLLVTVQEGASCPSGRTSDGVQFIDVQKAIAGDSKAAMGTVRTDFSAIEVAISVDNRTGQNGIIFVANEHAGKKQGDPDTVSAIDFKQALAFVSGKSTKPIVGTIPVDRAPVGLAVSSNGRYLYVTNEIALSGEKSCEIADNGCPPVKNPGPPGTLSVVDIHSGNVVADIPAGCSPTRVILTNNDTVAWVSARDSDGLLAFDTSKIINDPTNALLSTTPVGIEPDGAQPFSNRRLIAVANTNRFDTCAGAGGTVSILNFDTALNVGGDAATVGTFGAGVFPRQWALSPDGKLLYLTEFGSNTLAIFPVSSIVHQVQ
jgi:DNA-binding beta-propeller fold protein YncE